MASEWKIKVKGAFKPFWGIIFLPSTATKTSQGDRCAFKCEFLRNTDRGLKQLPGLKKTKMVMYSINSKLNSPFSSIGKATADKITATRLGKNSRFRFCVNNYFEHAVCEILNTFVLLDKSLLPHLE